MNILNKLTLKHLTMNKKRTIVTIIGITLSAALMVGIGLLFSSVRDNSVQQMKLSNGDHHVNISNLSQEQIDQLKQNGNIETVFYEQPIGFSPIESGNEYKPYLYLTGVSDTYFAKMKLIEGRYPENDREIVISDHLLEQTSLQYAVGDEITLDYGYRLIDDEKVYENQVPYMEGEAFHKEGTKKYTVVGIVKRTPYDKYSYPGFTVYTVLENNNHAYNSYLIYRNVDKAREKTDKIAKAFNKYEATEDGILLEDVVYNDSLLSLYGQSRYDNFNESMMPIILIMLSVVSVGCIIVIYNSFAISVMERKKQFGLFASIGATKLQLRKTVFFEAILVGTIGIILGIIGAFIGIGIVLSIANMLLVNVFEVPLALSPYPLFIIVPIIFMILVILLSAYLPARRASKITPIEAIRQNDDIKIRGKKVKTRRWVRKIFGMEGELALKNIKRNKKKYRITILSLVVSIVMFISFSAYLKYGVEGVKGYVNDIDFDIMLTMGAPEEGTQEEIDKAVDEILHHRQVKEYMMFHDYQEVHVKAFADDMFTDEYSNMKNNQNPGILDEFSNIRLVSLGDESYQKLAEKYHLTDHQPILVNHFRTIVYGAGTRKSVGGSIFNSKAPKTIELCNTEKVFQEAGIDPELADCSVGRIDDIYVISELPFGFTTLNDGSINVVVDEETYRRILKQVGGEDYNNSVIAIKAPKYNELEKKIDELLKNKNLKSSLTYENIHEAMKLQKNMVLVISILFYGFITLVTLIGVTSVFNTIYTSIALRRKEFAMLRSVGLTPKGFNRMLRFESIFFGLKSLLYAIPISFVLTFLMHIAMGNLVSFASILIPWDSILIAIVGVFVIVFITMMYSTHKIKRENILDAIREENI